MRIIFIYIFIFGALICLSFFFANNWSTLIFELILITLTFVITAGRHYLKNINLHRITTLSSKRNEEIRISFAYLIKITVKDEYNNWKYLLVKNSNFEAYQPPGGVYKYHDASYIENVAKDDINFHKKNDLRLFTKRKHIPNIIEKFNSGKGRETSIEREFYEELIKPKILSRSDFPWIKYKKVYQSISEISYSTHFQCNQIKVFDVFEVILSEEQKARVKELLNTENAQFIFATDDDIDRERYKPDEKSKEYRIADQTPLIVKVK